MLGTESTIECGPSGGSNIPNTLYLPLSQPVTGWACDIIGRNSTGFNTYLMCQSSPNQCYINGGTLSVAIPSDYRVCRLVYIGSYRYACTNTQI